MHPQLGTKSGMGWVALHRGTTSMSGQCHLWSNSMSMNICCDHHPVLLLFYSEIHTPTPDLDNKVNIILKCFGVYAAKATMNLYRLRGWTM